MGIASAFAIFFIGYLARPLGAFFFGYIGDRFGRKPALLISVWLMALSTCGIGLLPDYDTIGGPILLLLNLRILQGFSCGGELIGSIIFTIEHAPRDSRGFYGSFGDTGGNLGFLLAALIAWIINTVFNQAEIVHWAWRISFLLGFLIGFVGWFIRRSIPETELFQQTVRLPKHYLSMYREYAKQLRPGAIIVGMIAFGTLLNYLIYVFSVSYMSVILTYTTRQALSVVMLSIVLLVLLEPIMGKLGDRVGRRPMMIFGIIGSVIWIWPYFWLLQQQNVVLALLAQGVMTIFTAAYFAVVMVSMVEIVPSHLRFSVVAFSYAVAVSIFGGATPFIATVLLKTTTSYYSLAVYVSVCALISLFAVYKVRETRPKRIEEEITQSIIDVARKMLANGDSVQKVAQVTALSIEQVRAIES